MRNASGTPLGATVFRPMTMGAGGYSTGISISTNGATKVTRIDVDGAWVKTSTDTAWRRLYTNASLPTGMYGTDLSLIGNADSGGSYETVVAPNDATRLYGTISGRLLKSTNTGATWTLVTGVPALTLNSNTGNQKNWGKRIAVHPTNADVAVFGTQADGLYATTNGWTSVTHITSLAANGTFGGEPTPHLVAIDPTNTNRVFAMSQGTGIYQSTTGVTGTYTLMAGSPTGCYDMKFDQNGKFWLCDTYNSLDNVWNWTSGGGWVRITSTGTNFAYASVSINPANANHIVLSGECHSMDGGATWSGDWIYSRTDVYSKNIPWMNYGTETYLFTARTEFDPSVTNRLYNANGVGIHYCDAPTDISTGRYVWYEESLGIESMVTNVLLTPPGGQVLAGVHDKAVWRFNKATPNDVRPRGPVAPNNTQKRMLVDCWALDYAPGDPNFIVAWTGKNPSSQPGAFEHGYSTDGGQTFSCFPTEMPNPTSAVGGSIACAGTNDIIGAWSNDGYCYATSNRGTSWSQPTFPGLPSNATGWGSASYLLRRPFASDKDNPGTVYAYNYGHNDDVSYAGIWKSTTGVLGTWTKVYTGSVNGILTDFWKMQLVCVPGKAGHLFLAAPVNEPSLKRSTDGAVTWSSVTNVTAVANIGFGKAAPGQSYPTIFIIGKVSGVNGVWRSDDNCATWVNLTTYPLGYVGIVKSIEGDPDIYGRCYVGLGESGYAYGDYTYTMTLG